MLTYKSNAEAIGDRDAQRKLADALRASSTALRHDECGAWRIAGLRGHIYTWGDGKTWQLCVASGSPRQWMADKNRLSFCRVTQNGDDEGCLRLSTLPTAAEAAAIRKVLGIRKRNTANRGSYATERPAAAL